MSSFFNVWLSFGLNFISKILMLLACACMFVWRGRDRTGAYGWLTDTAHGDWRDTLVSAQCNISFWLLITVCGVCFSRGRNFLLWDFCPIFVLFLLCSSVIGRVVIVMLAPEFISGMVDVGVISHCFM